MKPCDASLGQPGWRVAPTVPPRALVLGKNRSDFMLEAACDRAQAVVLDQVFFALDEDKFRRFTQLLDAPPASNPGLDRLMAVKAPWSAKPGKR